MPISESVTLARSASGYAPQRSGIFDSIDVSATGLSAQRRKLNAIASNIANVDTTRTEEGGPYKRKQVLMIESPRMARFANVLQAEQSRLVGTNGGHMQGGPEPTIDALLGSGVETAEVREEPVEPRLVYDPAHPDAREDGYVVYPDINVVTEMVDMISASRAYEANVTAMKASKEMITKALEI
ncbi:MAG: flagellar basal body rod protein FlgC [bacterium]|jgi:flagellar basal-body rod protein FlgC|nr:flagellar basal body rod protein FlgC [bacterium]